MVISRSLLIVPLLVVGTLAAALLQPLDAPAAEPRCAPRSALAEHLQWIGTAVAEANYSMWDVSPIVGADGKTHLFCARWPEANVDPAWRKSSEIVPKIERPKVLVIDGRPAYLFGTSGWTVHGGPRTADYVLKIDLPAGAGPLPRKERDAR